MPDKQSSPEAMLAAIDWLYCDADTYSDNLTAMLDPEVLRLARIIAKRMNPKWIKCSERMPTKEDADERDRVNWLTTNHKNRVSERWNTNAKYFSHWAKSMPLPDNPEPEDG